MKEAESMTMRVAVFWTYLQRSASILVLPYLLAPFLKSSNMNFPNFQTVTALSIPKP